MSPDELYHSKRLDEIIDAAILMYVPENEAQNINLVHSVTVTVTEFWKVQIAKNSLFHRKMISIVNIHNYCSNG